MEAIPKYEVTETTWPETTFITKRATVPFDQLPVFFGEAYGTLYQAAKQAGIQVTEPPFAIYYCVDEEKKETDVAAAILAKGFLGSIAGLEVVRIPASKVLSLTYLGGYENMASAYAALDGYVSEHRFKKEWSIEQYFSDPNVEKDSSKWKTVIYFMVR